MVGVRVSDLWSTAVGVSVMACCGTVSDGRINKKPWYADKTRQILSMRKLLCIAEEQRTEESEEDIQSKRLLARP